MHAPVLASYIYFRGWSYSNFLPLEPFSAVSWFLIAHIVLGGQLRKVEGSVILSQLYNLLTHRVGSRKLHPSFACLK